MMLDPAALHREALACLEYVPTEAQDETLCELARFACAHTPREVFMLNGYAGTGKTSIVGSLIAAMTRLKMKSTVLAPTGRAAKVAEKYSAHRAATVHRHIYFRTGGQGGTPTFSLGRNNARDTLYIIDEASMVTDRGRSPMLHDLVRFIYSAPGCAMVLVGDTAQLPPVGQDDSPAMNPETLAALGLEVTYRCLDQPARQAEGSGILHNATLVRRMIESGSNAMPRLVTRGYDDIRTVTFYDFADELSTSWSTAGREESIIITRSNKRAADINHAVRTQIMYADSPLTRGERLIIAKNNYYWTRRMKGVSFLANGETVIVDWIGRLHKAYGLNFVDVEMHMPGREEEVIAAKVMLRSLRSEGPALPQAEMDELYRRVYAAKEGSPTERAMAALEDEYYNALQVKYAYCVTCHKAQGGQWRHVYIDLAAIMPDAAGESFLRWLYTALTRATERVCLLQPSIPLDS